jgi:hypothetical protein
MGAAAAAADRAPFARGMGENGPMTESLSGRLAPIVLPDSAGTPVRLGSLWDDRPAVVVFLRHYG